MAKQTTQRTLDKFFKRKLDDTNNNSCSTSQNQESKRSKASTSESGQHQNQFDPNNSKTPRQNDEKLDRNTLERDPGKRKQIWSYPVNKREEVRRAYINLGPYQIDLKEYPVKGPAKHPRKFQYSWFSIFPNWLEYSPTTHCACCFLCYLYSDKPNERQRSDVFIVKGFDKWKKVNDGKRCAFLKHLGSSQHKNALAFSENLLNQETHIENILEKRSKEKLYYNRLKLKASVDVIRWLTFQACASRGHDERPNSKNRGNFLQLLKLLASYNDELANVIMESSPYGSKYTSGDIQKELLAIIANNVRKYIRDEAGSSYFCLLRNVIL